MNIKKLFFILILAIFLSLPLFNYCYAASIFDSEANDRMKAQEDAFRLTAGFRDETGDQLSYVVATVIEVFLALLGVIFIILIILAGYNWMTAAGEEEKVKKAKDTIKRAIIGLAIVLAAYSITYFAFKYLGKGLIE